MDTLTTTTVPAALTVIAVDDHSAILDSLSLLPQQYPNVIASMRCYSHVNELDLQASPPDVVILDLMLDGGESMTSAMNAIPVLKDWGAKVVLYTAVEKPVPLRQALRNGADGLCLKTDGNKGLVQALATIATGAAAFSSPLARAVQDDDAVTARLTPQEIKVLNGLAYGLSVDEVSRRTFTAVATVKTHVENIRRKYTQKLGTPLNRSGLVWLSIQDGYINPSEHPDLFPYEDSDDGSVEGN